MPEAFDSGGSRRRTRSSWNDVEGGLHVTAERHLAARLERSAERLGLVQSVTDDGRRGAKLWPRVREDVRVLRDRRRAIERAAGTDALTSTPASVWLLENFPLIEEQIRLIRVVLAEGGYARLPKLASGLHRGEPRVLGIARAYLAHVGGRFDASSLHLFVRAYQRMRPLRIAELWALPISLRIALVETARSLAEPMVIYVDADAGEFGSEREQAEETESVRNVFTSLRGISDVDWTALVESLSLLDDALRAESDFASMDFPTRDAYRHAIEDLSRRSGRSEIAVARAALAAARRARSRNDSESFAFSATQVSPAEIHESTWAAPFDPGFHLVSKGRPNFEREIGARPSVRTRIRRAFDGAAAPTYLGVIGAVAALLVALPLAREIGSGGEPVPLLVLFAILAAFPAAEVAIALVNRGVAEIVRPKRLAKLELKAGPTSDLRTMVVVPTLLSSRSDVDELIARLEVNYLANSKGDVRFALLTDWKDSPTPSLPDDEELLLAAAAGIAALNRTHGAAPDGGERFLLLHRRRKWNESEGVFMGWERKRGKLHELNRLLRGDTRTSFIPVAGAPPGVPSGVRYVVTLDSDSRLPMGAVARLVGALAHPLNAPRLDPRDGRVVEGYGILQPRVTPMLPERGRGSRHAALAAGPAGLDPYASAVSDVYQDLFGEGSYTGKGIYEVDAFEGALAGRVPENSILSHDLFEGIFARAGLVTDVELFDEFPAHYEVAAARRHRWARGDWQLLPWILGRARDASGRRAMPRLSAIARWKMADNLRRTLTAPASVALLALAWIAPGVSPALWTGFVLASLFLPHSVHVLAALPPRRRGLSMRVHFRSVAADAAHAFARAGLATTMLAHEALSMTDATARTLRRLYATRRRLLEWTPAAQAKAGFDLRPRNVLRRMGGAVVATLLLAAAIALLRPEAALFAAPVLFLWCAAPAIARWISVPRETRTASSLSRKDAAYLRSIARRTWGYFETFVGIEDRFLPPDNVQEDPGTLVAHRTSPTNVGLGLLSVLAARDFGWIGTVEMVERLEATFDSMERLERHRGHFLNWYDTRDLRPLEPRYVSTVDSGNLAGHLVALANGCLEWARRPRIENDARNGVGDCARIARDEALSVAVDSAAAASAKGRLVAALDALLAATTRDRSESAATLDELEALTLAAADEARGSGSGFAPETVDEARHWTLRAANAIRSHRRDLDAATRASSFPCSLTSRLESLARTARETAFAMDFGFLFDDARKLFSIGWRVGDDDLDPCRYDLLDSEARLASYFAIAKGDAPAEHWFRLGRPMTPTGSGAALVSWAGSMFEHLMPNLVMRAPAGSLLEETARRVIGRQISYARSRRIPWGISESAYNARDASLAYRCSSFGVPGLGRKRGLADDLVVAPYATALAAMVAPAVAARNFVALARRGALGRSGFLDALDFTPSRVPDGAEFAPVRAVMAHHQGMTIVALANVLHDERMRDRFHAEPAMVAADLLLQERTPRDVGVATGFAAEVPSMARPRAIFERAPMPIPGARLLSDGALSESSLA